MTPTREQLEEEFCEQCGKELDDCDCVDTGSWPR